MATCTSCNQTLADGAKFCANCGATVGGPTYGAAAPTPAAAQTVAPPGVVYTKFCSSCGNGLVAAAVICPNCGAAQKGFSTSGGKSKTTAVLMAVFLSAWTWVYTWRANKKKFWIAFALWIVGLIITIAAAGSAASHLVCNQAGGGCTIQSSSGGIIVVSWLISFGIWLWAIIDTSTKSQAYYASI